MGNQFTKKERDQVANLLIKYENVFAISMKDFGKCKIDAFPSPKLGPRWALVSKTTELWGLEGMLLAFSTKRGRGVC